MQDQVVSSSCALRPIKLQVCMCRSGRAHSPAPAAVQRGIAAVRRCRCRQEPSAALYNAFGVSRTVDIYIASGYVTHCRSDDELAGVLAHEAGHIIAHHADEDVTLRCQLPGP